jgi:hypothetical protein
VTRLGEVSSIVQRFALESVLKKYTSRCVATIFVHRFKLCINFDFLNGLGCIVENIIVIYLDGSEFSRQFLVV